MTCPESSREKPLFPESPPLSVEHAVNFMLRIREPAMLGYRRRQLEIWRETYGDAFADQVKLGVKARWGRR